MGFYCSGPLEGTIFIDMTSRYVPTKKKIQKQTWKSRQALTPEKMEALSPSPSTPAVQFEDLCFSSFLDAMLSKRKPKPRLKAWLAYLPRPSAADSYPVLAPAIRAASMMFYSVANQCTSTRAEAHHWYEVSLNSHRTMVDDLDNSSVVSPSISGLISCSLVLAVFEIISCTVPDGSLHHFTAAAALVRMLGPSKCQQGMMHQMFRSIRLNECYISLMTGRTSVFCTEPWLTIPFEENHKTSFDAIVDMLVTITQCAAQAYEINCSQASALEPETARARAVAVRHQAIDIIRQLAEYSSKYELHLARFHGEPDTSPCSEGFTVHPSSSHFSFYLPQATYPDTLTASTVSLYDAANIVVSSILTTNAAVSAVERSTYTDHATLHSASILSVAAFQESTRAAGGDFMRTAYPLKVVSMLSPDEQQRRQAADTLSRWSEVSLLRGLCSSFTLPDHLKPY